MNDDLQFLVHFFNDRAHLFKTMTMVDPCQFDEISDQIAAQQGWYWFRYRQSDRRDYLARRLFVEKQLYDGYTKEYGHLKEKVPVYFYIYPKVTPEKLVELGERRSESYVAKPHILMIQIEDLEDTRNVTFTLNDSFAAFWKKAIDAGIKCRVEENCRAVLPDHNRVFPFSMIEEIHRKYQAQEISYEVQIWDYALLEKIRYTILGEEETV